MTFALVRGSAATPIDDGQPFTADDVQYPGNVPALWSADDLAAIGVYPVTDDPIPAGKVATSSALAVVDGRPVRQWVLANAPAAPVPDISDRQFGRGLWGDGIITFPECEAFVATGTIPAALQQLIDALPDDDTGKPTMRKEAIIFVRGAKTYEQANPFVGELGAAFGWSPAQIDGKWRAWALL